MRPGDLVELKEGLFGMKAPQNLGIFLERRKRKKEFWLVVATLKGVRDVRPEQVTGRRFHVSIDPGAGEEALILRLKDLVQEAQGGALDVRESADGGPTERTLWERIVNGFSEPRPVEGIASIWTEAPTKGDIRRIGELLDRCRRPGTGFFEKEGRSGWRPITVAEFKAFQRGMESVGRLRRRLVRVVSVEDDSGESWERLEGLRPDRVDLDPDERALLDAIASDMGAYVLHDAWPDDVSPPGTPVHTLEGRSYHQSLLHLAEDWTGTTGVTRSSTLVQFLVDAGLLSVQDAIRLIARRKVREVPGFGWETPEEIERWAERYEEPAVTNAKDPSLFGDRVDLRDLETYAIDPPDAKDFDDAVSLVEGEDGTATLWVHIADVSHYVEKDSRLDHHARERATSVYLPTGVLPMLPRRLSDGLCSLREQIDRLALSVRIEVDPDGRVTGWEPMETVIRVDENARYPDVDARIRDGTGPFARLDALARRMRRHRRGLDIETGELRIRFAEEAAHQAARREGLTADGTHIDGTADGSGGTEHTLEALAHETGLTVQIKHASPATKMVETFMVAANEVVSRFVAAHDVAVPYRCHPLPERGKAERFSAQAQALGLDVRIDLPEEGPPGGQDEADDVDDEGPSLLDQLKGGKLQLGGFAASETIGSRRDEEEEGADGPPGPQTDLAPTIRGLAQLSEEEQEAWLAPFRAALEAVEGITDDELRALAYMKVLSTLGRALYTPRNLGHFGLGSTSYAHFTSPIRRYPDLVLHRQLRWLLRKQAGREVDEAPPHMAEHLDALTDHCTTQGEAAERLERGLLSCCMTFESRRPEWSEALSAMVNGITPGGLFLSLPGNLEARLAMRDLPGGPYETDEHGTILFRARLPGGQGVVQDEEDDEDLLGLDWRELEDPDTGELREVRVRLGDRVQVRIRERDFVDGRVAVRLAGRL